MAKFNEYNCSYCDGNSFNIFMEDDLTALKLLCLECDADVVAVVSGGNIVVND